MTLSFSQAYEHAARGYAKTFGVDPSANEALVVLGVAWIETLFGAGWKDEGVDSWNMGAIQSSAPPCDPATEFLYTDTRPNDDGTSTPYQRCFKRYSSPADGFSDLVRVLFKIRGRERVRAAAEAGDWYEVSAAMYDTVYYQGFGPTREARIANHHRALVSSMARIAAALGISGPPRTLRAGMEGEDVVELQKLVGAAPADGIFGPATEKAVKEWQEAHGLTADGVWGQKSRAVAAETKTEPAPPADEVPVDDVLTAADRMRRISVDLRNASQGILAAAERLERAVDRA